MLADELSGALQQVAEQGAGALTPIAAVPEPYLWGLAAALLAGGVLLGSFVLLGARKLAHRRATDQRQELRLELALRMTGWALMLLGLLLAIGAAPLPREPVDLHSFAWRLYLTALVLFGCNLLYRIGVLLTRALSRGPVTGTGYIDAQLAVLLRDLMRGAAIVLAVVLLVEAWGYNATALLAGVGIGGLALAFAAQNTIGNIFGSLVIYSERPYSIGDWVTLGGADGIVEHIGMRCTHVRRWDKTLAIVPNRRVVEDVICNNSALTHRRIRFHLALKYNVDAALMRDVLARLEQLVREHPGITDHWLHVRLERFTPISQDILVQAYCGTTDYGEFLTIQQDLLLKVRELVDSMGAEIAVPTGTVVSGGGE